MSLFSGPEYASYIALCRELNLTKDRAEPGDVALIWLHHDDPPWVSAGGAWYSEKGFCAHGGHWHRDVLGKQGDGDIWLPRLDQWLALLEEAGVRHVAFQALHSDETSPFEEIGGPLRHLILPPEGPRYGCVDTAHLQDISRAWPCAPTREEAAARLWMAVTGRTVTA